ncbi:multidrug ABC transporter ATP-binding protein [Paenibacillus montaniterrae]|uniref:Multidrug ABC transporter ATP-binding protein n=2 Tax=Paenibacillus montaniterrae TaxID=429341 RepID=A0A920CXV4_9BACL|nr:multidrug ABC transporter ATP-binding protein [Paenibacillus montaniterrae]
MWTVVRTIFRYLVPYKLLTLCFLLLFGLDLLFVSVAPLSFNYIIDYAVAPKDMDVFLFIAALLLGFGIVCTIAGVFGDRLLSRLNALVEQDLRRALFSKLQQLHISYFQAKRTGDSVILFSNDIPAISSAMTALLSTGIQSLVVVMVSMSILLYLQWSMALLIIMGAAVIFVGPLLLNKRASTRIQAYREQAAGLNSDVTENVKAQKLIKSYSLQQLMLRRFEQRLKSLFVSSYQLNLINAALGRVPMISLLLVNLTIMLYGSYLAIVDRISLGELVAFYTMYMSMGNSVFNLTFIIPSLTSAKVSIERLAQVMEERDEQIKTDLPASEKVFKPASKASKKAAEEPVVLQAEPAKLQQIAFDRVSFGYEPERQVLHDITLSIPQGANIAFVGSSGSGKSSMVQLLLGLYEPAEGTITVNGAPLGSAQLASYRQQLAVVFQDNFLFQGTIKENIAMSSETASDEDIIRAAQLAEIHDFIMSLPDGYATKVYDEGSNFSGGQRQRLAIARALVREPQLLILDEATSALDPATEAAINQTINRLARQRTVISVTHRLSTVADADLICVFDEGRLVEQGTHEQLLARQGQFYYLWEKQTGFTLSEESDDVQINASRLSQLAFFKQISPEVLEDIAMLFNTERFASGATIIEEGARGEKFYILIRGKVEVLKQVVGELEEQQRQVAVLEDGDHFGEIALLQNVPRTATIKALTPCVVITLQRKVLQHLLSKHPDINSYVVKVLQERLG